MVNLVIDGKEVKAERRTPLLKIAREMGISIPTLCYHPALEPYGACRLCVVEIERKGRRRIVTSCNYPAEEGLKVETDNERVRKIRKVILEFLLARCPGVKLLQELGEKYGVERKRFGEGDEECILCGLCVKVCSEIIGKSAISFSERGITRRVSPPFEMSASDCIGCGACFQICPTGAIKMEDREGFRIIHNWKVRLPLEKCRECGRYIAPLPYLEHIRRYLNIEDSILFTCEDCKRRYYARKLAVLGQL